MHLERKKDLSVLYWLKDMFSSYDFVTVVDGFPEQGLEIPTVSVEWGSIRNSTWELGNRSGDYIRSWYIDVFAKNKAQLDDFTYVILEAMENPIPVYDYDEGFPPDVSPTQLGYMTVTDSRIQKIRVMAELVEKMHYRSQVLFTTEYGQV